MHERFFNKLKAAMKPVFRLQAERAFSMTPFEYDVMAEYLTTAKLSLLRMWALSPIDLDLAYMTKVTHTTLTLGAALVAALVCSAYRAQVSAQKAQFETERRRLQAKSMHEIEAAKAKTDAANKSRSEFLANMSHDIRTPMNAIVSLTKLMEHDKYDPEKMDAYLHKIQTSSQHLLSLIDDVLDMSKIESSEVTLGREPISLADQVAQIDSIIRSQAESRSQTFTIRVHELTHEHFIGDAMRLRQLHHLSRRSHAV